MALSGRGRRVLRTRGDGRRGPWWLPLARAGSWGCMEGCPLFPWALTPAGGQQGVVGRVTPLPLGEGGRCMQARRQGKPRSGRKG